MTPSSIMSSISEPNSTLVGLRVLVVEDEELIAMLVEDFLNELGCSVIGPAASVADGLSLATTSKISGALLDLSLNGDPVYPVADCLVARGIPFIFTTGHSSEDVIDRHAGAPTLVKPYNTDLLREAMAAHFRAA
jgi:DNA-binding response OmpR family regulator